MSIAEKIEKLEGYRQDYTSNSKERRQAIAAVMKIINHSIMYLDYTGYYVPVVYRIRMNGDLERGSKETSICYSMTNELPDNPVFESAYITPNRLVALVNAINKELDRMINMYQDARPCEQGLIRAMKALAEKEES